MKILLCILITLGVAFLILLFTFLLCCLLIDEDKDFNEDGEDDFYDE